MMFPTWRGSRILFFCLEKVYEESFVIKSIGIKINDTSVISLVLICNRQISRMYLIAYLDRGEVLVSLREGGNAGFSTMYSHNTMVEYCIHRAPVNRNTNSIS